MQAIFDEAKHASKSPCSSGRKGVADHNEPLIERIQRFSRTQLHKEKLPHMKLAVVPYPYKTLNHSGHKWFIS